jgi:hypothetical protein
VTAEREYREKLAAVRAADAAHEAEMKAILDGSGLSLRTLRALPMAKKDTALLAAIKRREERRT